MSGESKYASVVITVYNAQPGQSIGILLGAERGGSIGWSTGDPSGRSVQGITMSATGGAPVPLAALSISGNAINVRTDGGSYGGSLSFSISACMCATTGLQLFKIMSTSDAGPSVMFQFQGRQPIALSQSYAIIDWPFA